MSLGFPTIRQIRHFYHAQSAIHHSPFMYVEISPLIDLGYQPQIRGPAPNDTMWLNITTYSTVFGIQEGFPNRLNPNSDLSTTPIVPDRAEGMQMEVIGFDGVSPLKDSSSTPQTHTIWVAYEVSISLEVSSCVIFEHIS